MSLCGILKFILHRTVEILIIALLIIFIPNLPPNAKFSEPYKIPPARPFEGKLALNNRLDDVEIWHKGDLLGAEAFADFNGQLYTTLHGGDIVKLIKNHITPVAKFGKPCKGTYQERICGRPLGIAFDNAGILYAADAYYGIFKVNVNTGKYEKLISIGEEIDGVKVKLPNSIAVSSNGDLFWTDSSTEFSLEDGVFDMLADGSGRLIRYNPRTRKNTVLITNLHFANGVVLSEDEEVVLVSETARSRIHRYYLNGPKQGTHDIFIDRLPGLTDNLKSLGKNGYLVPLVMSVDDAHPGFNTIFGPFPKLRKLMARVLGLFEGGFKLIDRTYPNEFSQRAIHFIGHFSMAAILDSARVTIIHVSKTGEILDSIHILNKKISGISEAHIFGDSLYLGSPFNDYIGRISLKKIGWEHLKQLKPSSTTTTEPPRVSTTSKPATTTTTTSRPTTTTPKPTTTTPKPTTTTPKPTTTTPKPTTTTPKPTTTTPKPTTATPKPINTSPRPATTTTTPKPISTTQKSTTKSPQPSTTTSTTPSKKTSS